MIKSDSTARIIADIERNGRWLERARRRPSSRDPRSFISEGIANVERLQAELLAELASRQPDEYADAGMPISDS